jgi:hypothetical protein
VAGDGGGRALHLGGACAREGDAGSTGEGKRARKNLCSCFIGHGKEREWRPGQLAIDGHGGRPGLDGIQGGGLMGKE